MRNGILVLLATAAFFTACPSSLEAAKREPKANLGKCIDLVLAWNITVIHDIASFMGVSKERMPALFCQRLFEGVRSGRISYADANRLQLDQPTEIWKVIKGK